MSTRSPSAQRENERKRRWEREHDRPPCPQCGEPRCVGAHRKGKVLCASCRRENDLKALDVRDHRIAELRATGMTIAAMAAEFGWTPNHMGVQIVRARQRGNVSVPRRYQRRAA